ncbi:outer membrane beta-barrel protein [Mucilaginibacter sp.]|uniref:outer membrane beta-barrel protein n=1 Tax=Mucilaginibacter sp. TaxID=1882438 RepID=UPI003AFFE7CF
MTFILVTLTCLLLVRTGNARQKAATLTGSVKDSLTRQGLPHATIVVTNMLTSVSVNTISSDKGNFTISHLQPGKYQLKVLYVGYNTFTKSQITIGDKQQSVELEVYMCLQIKSLKSVVISAKVAKPFITLGGGKITLNVAQSPLSAGSNAYDILLKAPGVVEQNNVLSFRTKSVNVLIDDKPTHLSDEELKEMLSSMPAGSIDKIEILPNPSARYDAQAGSIINIKLAKNKNYGLNGSLTLGLGTGRFLKYNNGLNLNYRSEKLNFYGAYDFQHTKQYYDNKFNREIDASSNILQHEYEIRSRNNNAYRLGFDYDVNKHNSFGIGFKGYTNYRSKTATTVSNLVHATENDSSSVVHTNGSAKVLNPAINVYYKGILDSSGKSLTINADYFNYNKKWQDNFATDYFDRQGNPNQPTYFLRDNSPAHIHTYSFSADYSQPSSIGKIEAGVKSQFTVSENDISWQQLVGSDWMTDNGKTNTFIYKENVNAAYINLNKTIKQFNLVLGVRAEQTNVSGDLVNTNTVNKKNYLNIFPNISFEFVRNLDNVLDISYRKSIQRFGFNIVNPFVIYQSQYAYYQGNSNIQPEIDHNLEVSYSYKQSLVFGSSYTHGTNALAPVYLKGNDKQVISTFDNLRSSDLFYVYADFTHPVTAWWNIYISGGTGFLKYNTATSSLSGQNNNASWSYLFQTENTFKFNNNWAAELNANYRGPYTSGIYKAARNFTTGTGISKGIFKNRANIKLAVQDIFNTDKQDQKINYQGVMMNVVNKAETRFFNMAISWKFGNRNIKARKQAAISTSDDIKQRVNNNQ